MEMKEALIRVLEKMNCKEMIKTYKVHIVWADPNMEIVYYVPCPTKASPDAVEHRNISYHADLKGFLAFWDFTKPTYLVTDDEAVEIEYLYHSIRKKAEEVRLEQLVTFL